MVHNQEVRVNKFIVVCTFSQLICRSLWFTIPATGLKLVFSLSTHDCRHSTADRTFLASAVYDDPHMTGLLGQKVDWIGEDGGWYNLVMDPAFTINERVTAPAAS